MPESKIGPKEAEVRALREARVAKNKKLIDKQTKLKKVGNVVNLKASRRGKARGK